MTITPFTVTNSLNMSDSALYDFVTNYSSGAYIKDSKTGAFLITNKHFLKFFGKSKTKDVVNLNVYDFDKFMRPFWGNNYAKQIAKMDNKVITESTAVIKHENIILNIQNEVCISDIIKLPLIGRNNKVNAILSIVTDLTSKIDMLRLFNLYKTTHHKQSLGMIHFAKYLGLNDFFQKSLTCQEINCLLHMRIDPAYKRVAKKLNITQKTTETHISNIIKKLKYRAQLSDVLSHLRTQKNP